MNPFITDDVRITDIRPLISPAILMQDFPASHEASKVVFDAREEFRRILKKEDDRLAVMVGPCSPRHGGSHRLRRQACRGSQQVFG